MHAAHARIALFYAEECNTLNHREQVVTTLLKINPFCEGFMKKKDASKSSPLMAGKKECGTCLYVNRTSEGLENCLRFARFVDHTLNEASKDCDYWTPAAAARP